MVEPGAGRRQGGFSLLELVVVIILVAILFTIAIDRLLKLRVEAERVAMEQVVGSLRSALGIEVAARVLRQGIRSVWELEGSNPMALLQEPPKNYQGELASVHAAPVAPGWWYFDLAERVLVYRVSNNEYFEGGPEGPARVRFRVEMVFTDRDGNGRYDPGVDDIGGLRLAVLEPYSWDSAL